MDATKLTSLIMNPVRLRIVQYLILHETGTCAEMGASLGDVPTASLYRHVRLLEQAGAITVVSHRRVRGAVEKTYVMNQRAGEPGDMGVGVQQMLLHFGGAFAAYFAREDPDPVRDMLFLTTSTLMLTDEEFEEMLGKFGAAVNDYVALGPAPGKKPRRVSWISSPPEEE